jgi:hypothetical protein
MNLSDTVLKTFQHCHFSHHQQDNRGLPSRPRPAAHSSRALHDAVYFFLRAQAAAQSGRDAVPCTPTSLEREATQLRALVATQGNLTSGHDKYVTAPMVAHRQPRPGLARQQDLGM